MRIGDIQVDTDTSGLRPTTLISYIQPLKVAALQVNIPGSLFDIDSCCVILAHYCHKVSSLQHERTAASIDNEYLFTEIMQNLNHLGLYLVFEALQEHVLHSD